MRRILAIVKCFAVSALALACPNSLFAQSPPATEWNVFVAPMGGAQEREAGLFQRDGNAYVLRTRTGPGTDVTAALLKVSPEGRIEWEHNVGEAGAKAVSASVRPNARGEATVSTISQWAVNGSPAARYGLERTDRWGLRRWSVFSETSSVGDFDPVKWAGSEPGALVLWKSISGPAYQCQRIDDEGRAVAQADLNALFQDVPEIGRVLESPQGNVYVTGRASSLTSFIKMLPPGMGHVAWTRDLGQDTVVDACACQDGGLAVITYGPNGQTSHDLTKYDRTGARLWSVNYYKDVNHLLEPLSLTEGPSGRLYIRAHFDWGGVLNESTGHVYVFGADGSWSWFGQFFRELRSSVTAVQPGPAECAVVAYGGTDDSGGSSTAVEFVSGNSEHVWLKLFTKGTLGFDSLRPNVAVDPDDAVLVAGTASKSGQPDRLWLAKYLLGGTGTLFATAVKPTVGKTDQGALADLKVRDDKALVVSPIGTRAGAFRAQVVVDGVQSLFERTPVSVNVASRLSASGRATLSIEQWDWTKSKWVVVKSGADVTSQTESAVWPLPGPYARFVGSGGKMKTRLTYDYRPSSGAQALKVQIDKCTWTALAP